MNGDTVLRLFWWLVLGAWVATIGVALVRELGLAVLLPYLGRTDDERRALIARKGTGEGHPVWLLLGGALVGAWWPLFNATLFSGLWLVLLFMALALLVGPVGHGYRKHINASFRGAWDGGWMLIALAALLVFGLAAGVAVTGVPLHFDQHTRAAWGSFAMRFTPYDVLVPGFMTIAFGVWLAAASVARDNADAMAGRARQLLLPAGGLVLLIFVGGAIWATQLPGYAVGGIPKVGASPLHGTTFAVNGAYLERFFAHLSLVVVPALTALAILGGLFYAWLGKVERVGAFAAASVVGMVATLAAMTYPVILPSFSMPSQSLTLWNAAAERPVMIALLAWLAVLVPAAVGYQMWLRRRGRSGSVQAGETAR
ncbi:MAG TPA: cytochrome d ubiquinol oxidase subunit II [Gammaproteobacteria bacterium]|nr:cytochrome d ubiquinol oxidase subunit II [Gammaproteobacteria bacterium]